MRIYVGSLAYSIDSVSLQALFAKFGIVLEANVVRDLYTGLSKGFGFVDMPDANHARQAICSLGGRVVEGHMLTVNESLPREDRIARPNSSGN